MSELVKAPWDDEQLASLNGYQLSGVMHPFTCGQPDCRATLVARQFGWFCWRCGNHTQDWAHPFMTNWSWKEAYHGEAQRSEAAEAFWESRRINADQAFELYDFGDMTVEATSGWVRDKPDSWRQIVYLKGSDEGESQKHVFVVNFQTESTGVHEAYFEVNREVDRG